MSIMALLVRVGVFLLILTASQLGFGEQIYVEQDMKFKWQGLTVATMRFSAQIPISQGPYALVKAEEQGKISIIGETKGPMRWIKDYRATISLVENSQQKPGSAFLLTGEDNGAPELRRVIFTHGKVPTVEIFKDSTAPDPLEPTDQWRGNTDNPLQAFARLLRAAAQKTSCANEYWGFDGKRRYRLKTRDNPSTSMVSGRELVESVTEKRSSCIITVVADGRESAGEAQEDRARDRKKGFGRLWPFTDGDREFIFQLSVETDTGSRARRVNIQRITIPTPIGAIVGR
jgi:hypothetical protein